MRVLLAFLPLAVICAADPVPVAGAVLGPDPGIFKGGTHNEPPDTNTFGSWCDIAHDYCNQGGNCKWSCGENMITGRCAR